MAFLLSKPLRGPNVTISDVLNATDRVTPALEIIDARWSSSTAKPVHPERSSTPSPTTPRTPASSWAATRAPDQVDLRWVSALLYINGVIEESGVAAAVLGHPATGVAWLARRLHRYGEQLEAGEIVLAGSFTRPSPGHRRRRPSRLRPARHRCLPTGLILPTGRSGEPMSITRNTPPNRFKQKLAAGEQQIGLWSVLADGYTRRTDRRVRLRLVAHRRRARTQRPARRPRSTAGHRRRRIAAR